jgi:cytoskeletal protein CcmA (bactofilin family)
MIGIKQKEENPGNGLHNTLAVGTMVKGNIIAETDFRLDGNVEGDINCKSKIVVGPKAHVKGNIVSTNAEILGEVEGSIHAEGKLVLKSTANVKGDVFVQSLEMEPNARLNGVCNMPSANDAAKEKKAK